MPSTEEGSRYVVIAIREIVAFSAGHERRDLGGPVTVCRAVPVAHTHARAVLENLHVARAAVRIAAAVEVSAERNVRCASRGGDALRVWR